MKPINWEWQYGYWLARYRPADEREAAHFEVHRACWQDREIGADRAVRHLTASAFVRSPDMTRVLAHRHPKLGRWLQPGGHVEPGEDPITAAVRELREEVGLDVAAGDAQLVPCILDLDVHRIPAKGDVPAHDHVDARFLFVVPDEALPEAPEGTAFSWVSWQELAAANADDAGLARVANKALDAIPRPLGTPAPTVPVPGLR